MGALAIDRTDVLLLTALQRDGRASYQALGSAVGLSAPAVLQRLRKLEAQGVIVGYGVRIDPGAVGRGLAAYLRVRPGEATDVGALVRRWRAAAGILECHRLVADGAFLLKLRPADFAELEQHADAARRAGCQVEVDLVSRTAFEGRDLLVESGGRF